MTAAAPAQHAGGAVAMSLVFRAGPWRCALRLDEVIETMRPLQVRPLAGTPDFVPGISITRGTPVPVVDMATLIAGEPAEVNRFVAVRTDRGPVVLATGPVLGIRPAGPDTGTRPGPLLGGTSQRLVAAVGTMDTEPLLLLRSMRQLPDEVWAAAAAAGS